MVQTLHHGAIGEYTLPGASLSHKQLGAVIVRNRFLYSYYECGSIKGHGMYVGILMTEV